MHHNAVYTIDKGKDKDSFIGKQEFVVGYSKVPEQPQSSARPICHSHTMTSTGHEPATIHIAACRSSLRYALCHGRRLMKPSITFGGYKTGLTIMIRSRGHGFVPL